MGLNALMREEIHTKNSVNLFKHLEWLCHGDEHGVGSLDPFLETSDDG